MELGRYRWHRRAYGALLQFTSEERSQILALLDSYPATPIAEWPAALASELPGHPGLYLVNIDEGFRLLIRSVKEEPPEVLDLVHQGLIDFFRQQPAAQGA